MNRELPGSPEPERVDEGDLKSRLNQLSPEAQALFSIWLHEASEKIIDVVEQLPEQWPNREALREHVAAIRKLIPPLPEEWQ